MRAAARFVEHHLEEAGRLQDVVRVRAEVFGSLALMVLIFHAAIPVFDLHLHG